MGMYCEVTAAAAEDRDQFTGDPNILSGFVGRGATTTETVSLEKAWHGLHYLLTGEVWEGQGPLAFLLSGGELLGDDEESGMRWFTPEETSAIHQALSAVTDQALWSRFDADELAQQEIYPGIWDEPEADLREEYLSYFNQLKQVVASAAQNGQGLRITLG